MKTKISVFIFISVLNLFIFNCYTQTLIDSLEIQLQIEDDPVHKVNLMLALAEELESQNLEAALEHAQQALKISIELEDIEHEMKAYNILGKIHVNKTEFKLAMDYAVMARNLALKFDNKIQLCHAIYTIGNIYADLGNYEKASEILYECLQLSEQINDQVTKVRVLNSIGIIHHHQKNYDKALEYYFKSLTIAKQIGYSKGIARGLNNVAAIYGTQGKFGKVVQYLRESIELNLRLNNMDLVGVNYLNFGYYFQEMQQYDSALYYYNKSLGIYENLDNISSIISAKIFLAEYYLEVGDLEKSKQYAEQSLYESRANGLKRFVYEIAIILKKSYAIQNDSIKSLHYQVLELQMKDSLNIEESQTELSKLELQYELQKEDQKQHIIQQRKDLINIIVLISLIFIIIVIILFLGRLRIKSRAMMLENDKLEMNLELRNKELTANVMSIMKKNETLSKIASKLKLIQKEAVKDETKLAIKKITRELNRAVDEEPWEEFELRFKQVHSDFYNKLIDRFPTLSPQEQRLCAFLRLNMTTKEISEITGQRTSTIEMARTRLRKKLGITNTQTNLITFLTQI